MGPARLTLYMSIGSWRGWLPDISVLFGDPTVFVLDTEVEDGCVPLNKQWGIDMSWGFIELDLRFTIPIEE